MLVYMSKAEAHRIVGRQASVFVRNMAVALSLHAWSNTPEEWRRLEAACVALGHRAPKRSREILAYYKTHNAH